MKKFTAVLTIFILTLLLSVPSFAKTQIVSEDILPPPPRIQSRGRKDRNPPPPPPRPRHDHYDSSDLASDLLSVLWLAYNSTITFEQYPYAADNKYINFNKTSSSTDRDFRFSLSTGLFCLPQFASGIETAFEGYIFKCFGPYCENTIFGTLNTNFSPFNFNYSDLYGNFKLGGQLALFQFNPLSLSLYVQWIHWYSITSAPWVNDKNGVTVGMNLRSYPVKPLVLEFRVGCEAMNSSNDTFVETELKAGFMVKSMEIYLAWKYRNFFMNETIFVKESNGIASGVRFYF